MRRRKSTLGPLGAGDFGEEIEAGNGKENGNKVAVGLARPFNAAQ
jgi:hypothetical protein